jgi:hypothetical protein
MGDGLFWFKWPVDQDGYELDERTEGLLGDFGGLSFQENPGPPLIRGRGGPPRYYHPLEAHPALWCEFAAECVDDHGILRFANKYGLLGNNHDGPESSLDVIDDTLREARVARAIAAHHDAGSKAEAMEVFNDYAQPLLIAGIQCGKAGKQEIKMVPRTLRNALRLQMMDAITGQIPVRRCKNCTTWFPYGPGQKATVRKQFCSDRCRVAFDRHGERQQLMTTAKVGS